MVTQTSVGRNQWRSEGRLRFPVNGLVLYAPLWNSGLSSDPFNAWNVTGGGVHSCDVIGTTWGIQGRTFDGGDDYIDCGNGASLNVAGNAITIITWLKPDVVTGGHILVGKPKAATAIDPYFSYVMNQNADNMDFRIDATVFGTTDNSLTNSAFHQYANVYDGANMSIYHNGVFNVSTAKTGNLIVYNETLLIGKDGWGELFDGTIGEVWIYNRALSAAEIQQIYLATKGRYI